MAEILVAALDLASGYDKGDPITVQENGWSWGSSEGLPQFWQIVVTDATVAELQPWVIPLKTAAQPGDTVFDAPDATDRFITRHRRAMRFMADELPANIENTLEEFGRWEGSRAQASPFLRQLTYNETTDTVEKTPNEVLP